MVKIPYGSKLIDMDVDLRNLVNTKRLRELMIEKKSGKIVIVVDDHTREAPTEKMLDAIIEEIEEEA